MIFEVGLQVFAVKMRKDCTQSFSVETWQYTECFVFVCKLAVSIKRKNSVETD
ncbi:hypothetical protein EV144_10352 [Flavobacterium sp. 270]|nr:hypothetical protein EV144_10352 [Flavobacterium sp. 270]